MSHNGQSFNFIFLSFTFSFLKRFYLFVCLFIYLFILERRGWKEKRWEETSISCLSCAPKWEPGPQPNMCPDRESNLRCSSSQAGTQPAEPHQPGLILIFNYSLHSIFFKRFYLFIFRERRREGERKGEKHQCVVASHTPPTGDLARNPGACPDWESNQGPLTHRPALNALSHTSQAPICAS